MRKSKHIHRTFVKPWEQPRHARRRSLARAAATASLITLGLLLQACETTAPAPPVAPSEPVETSTSAAALMQRAERAAADRAAALYLQAAWAYLEEPASATDPSAPISTASGPDYAGAQRAYAALEPGWLPAELLPDYHLLTATLALHNGTLAEAKTAMDLVPYEQRRSQRGLLIWSALCEADGDYACALRTRVAAAGDDPDANEAIWQLLNRSISLAEDRRMPPALLPEYRHLPGWLTLQQAVVRPFSRSASREAITTWLAANPDHPAALIPPATVTGLLDESTTRTHVALLLPLSGPLARAGESVRDGFFAASLSAEAGDWLTISVHDSAAEPLPVLYERILADGADLVVGPLQKSAVSSMSELNPAVPVLALNYLEPNEQPAVGFGQFGLAIEDEARTIARRLQADGVTRALLFHNYDDWSLRARRSLTEDAAGSDLALTVQPFTDVRTITESVGAAMHVAGSQNRRDELSQLLGEELEFLPRAREDVDAVVALIDNTEANALVPALRFHFANHLPIYASSQTTRRARAGRLNELGGFHVSELPYFLAGDPVFAALAEPFDLSNNPFASLTALGSDAFRLAERLDGEGDLVLLGSTGLLRQHPDGRITRELAWGTIAGGKVRGSVAPAAEYRGAGD